MQQYEIEDLLRSITHQTGNPDALQTAERIRSALSTQEGQQAAQQIIQKYSGTLENAAFMAQSGNLDGAKKSVQHLMTTPEGARLAAQIAKMMGR